MRKVEINKAKPIPNQANVRYGDGVFLLETNGAIAGIQINYIGMMQIAHNLPDGWFLKMGRNKIIIFGISNITLPELLFKYRGDFKVRNVQIVDWHLNKSNAKVVKDGLHYWGEIGNAWDVITEKYEKLDKSHEIGIMPTDAKIFKTKKEFKEEIK